MIYTKCHKNTESRVTSSLHRESFAAEVMFNPGLEEPVIIGQDGKKEES